VALLQTECQLLPLHVEVKDSNPHPHIFGIADNCGIKELEEFGEDCTTLEELEGNEKLRQDGSDHASKEDKRRSDV
jgi:hypothetical protein